MVSVCRGPGTPLRRHVRSLLSRVGMRRGAYRVIALCKCGHMLTSSLPAPR